MKPCPKCGAAGSDPCLTRSGAEAHAWHKPRTQVTRSPRALEEAFALAAGTASWLGPVDAPAVLAAATLARQIDDKIHSAETREGLFPVAPLGEEGGSITYDLATFVQLLDGLGLTPKGRHLLALTEPEAVTDALASVLELHGA